MVLVVAHITSPHFNQALSNPDGTQAHITKLKELRRSIGAERRVDAVVKTFLYDRDKGESKLQGTVQVDLDNIV